MASKTTAKKRAAKLAKAREVLASKASPEVIEYSTPRTVENTREELEMAAKNKPKQRVINNPAFTRTIIVEDNYLVNHFVFFNDVIDYNDGVTETRTGITTMESIRSISGTVPIDTHIPILDARYEYQSTGYEGTVIFSRNHSYSMLAQGLDPRKEFMLPTTELWEEYKKQHAEGKDKADGDTLYLFIYCDKLQLLYNLYYTYVTLPFVFNKDSYHIDNEHFDLEALKSYLEQLSNSEEGKGRIYPSTLTIMELPEEECTENCNKTLTFTYVMKNSDFNKERITEGKAIPYIKDNVFRNILKLEQFRLPSSPKTYDLREEILKERRITQK